MDPLFFDLVHSQYHFLIHEIFTKIAAQLKRGKSPSTSVLDDIKQSDGEAPVLELWWMSTPSLPLLPGPLWLGVVVPDGVLSMDQIELFDI